MLELSSLFSSTARTKVLQVLHGCVEPIHLRLIGSLCECPIRSVELAIAGLIRDKLVVRLRVNKRYLYQLNLSHPAAELLNDVFVSARRSSIRSNRGQLNARAGAFVPFIRDASNMIRAGKMSVNESR